ncbi:hypothetical protein ONA70_17995 [Micromonospora yasonensis]|uniref:DUF7710 domain-containing protein n=1 Tax=Micromonospora yasonensis TaxID=1128667 RepID=UPI00222F66A4|nr:hypothetical protein [Micromonospora yasonensis]MCW3841995.1 hypothetical protein [Micromonospora yasonensis]
MSRQDSNKRRTVDRVEQAGQEFRRYVNVAVVVIGDVKEVVAAVSPLVAEWKRRGLHRRPTGDQRSPIRSTVWIFHGDRARYASGVFDTLDTGLAWAAEHQVTGILAEYANGGAYNVAVSEGRFTPSKTHHGTADHVAAFGSGLRHIHLTDGRRD